MRQNFGRYELLFHLARGGMADLWVARMTRIEGFEKIVALKRIREHLASDEQFVQLFLSEARLAATLDHPNIVQVHDVGLVDAEYYIAMEYVHGADVRAILKAATERGRALSLDEALSIVLGMCAGLHHAHEKVVIHQDVSPSNVLVSNDGAVKVADFGIAQAQSRRPATEPRPLRGKSRYMSPEQCRGEALDRRSDVFAIAVMLYELTTGTNAYSGEDDTEILRQIAAGPPPRPSAVCHGYLPELEKIALRGLEHDVTRRYQTAQALQVDLEALVRARRLAVSPLTLAKLMEELFGSRIEAWRSAQRAGTELGEHIAQTGTLSIPVLGTRPAEDPTASASLPTLSPAKSRRVGPWVAAAAGLAVLGGSLAWWVRPVAPAPPPPVAFPDPLPVALQDPPSSPPPPPPPAPASTAHESKVRRAKQKTKAKHSDEKPPERWDPDAPLPP